ncbi:MAG: polysaccharide biosynthesis tyrosine autokinase [Bacteroidales bacterium]|nr:polysaccharide biosynthesis tyrosine autokinase [Bacteroidales bacterium]
MQQKKISLINENFDPQIFRYILKKSFWIIAFIIIISVIAAFVYMRYTPRVYKATSIIQICENNKANKILNFENYYENKDISNIIELLRSKEFLRRTFDKLPLNVRYYVQGTFLSNELYRSSPYIVYADIKNTDIYDIPLYIYFNKDQTSKISYEINGKIYEYELIPNTWKDIYGAKIHISINNFNTILEQINDIKQDEYFFVIKNPNEIIPEHINNLEIYLLNKYANTISISYKGNNATISSEIVNVISEEFIKYDIEKKKEGDKNILSFIDDQLKTVYKNLDETEKKLHEFKIENKISFTNNYNASPFPLFVSKINEFENEILNLEFELVTLKQINEKINNNNKLNIYELIALLTGTKSEAIVVNILNNLQQLLNQKEQLLNDVTANNYKIKVLEKQINNQRQILTDFIKSTITRLSDKNQDYKEKIAEYENKIFNESSFNEIEYSKLERLYSINEGFYHKLIEKKAEYLISQAGYVSENIILEKANTPRIPISPINKKIYFFFVIIGIVIGILIILVRYLFYNEITSINSLKSYSNAPVLGSIPFYKKEIPCSQLLVDKKPNSMFSEAFRIIRSNLEYIAHGKGPKVMAVSSTISGEGKTFIAINLAGIIALSGKKVILMDLDLRKPKIHQSFESENQKGISTILINKHNINECIKHTEIKNFDFITAGPIPPNPSELVLGKEMKNLIETLKNSYDTIIIDTPPAGIISDALTHFQRADYPIYVIKANFSKRNFLQNVNNLISEKNLTNLSLVLNNVEYPLSKSGYGYGYGYYEDDEIKRKKVFIKKMFFFS